MGTMQVDRRAVDERAVGSLSSCDCAVAGAWRAVTSVAQSDRPGMGLQAGERPAADVEVLSGTVAAAEYALADRMHAAADSGDLPLAGPGGMLVARGWSNATARRLARAGALAAAHPSVADAWSAGVITSEHVDPVSRHAERFTAEELAAVIEELRGMWGRISPSGVARFITAADRLLHPPADPSPREADAYQSRDLSFSLLGDTVLLSGALPRVEGELVIAALDAIAETLRSEADHVPPGARRVDALVQLVNTAHGCDSLPTRGGLPVALTVTLQHTAVDDPLITTSRGHVLTDAEGRWATCDATVIPVVVTRAGCDADPSAESALAGRREGDGGHGIISSAQRISALAGVMFDTRIPLAMGRTQRTASAAQRRALAVRDGVCIIPGCQVPAEACQVHHLQEWAGGGSTDLANLATVCWAHHRQVDLRMWTISPLDGRAAPSPPQPGAPPGTPWPANNGAPFTITRTPRNRWRL